MRSNKSFNSQGTNTIHNLSQSIKDYGVANYASKAISPFSHRSNEFSNSSFKRCCSRESTHRFKSSYDSMEVLKHQMRVLKKELERTKDELYEAKFKIYSLKDKIKRYDKHLTKFKTELSTQKQEVIAAEKDYQSQINKYKAEKVKLNETYNSLLEKLQKRDAMMNQRNMEMLKKMEAVTERLSVVPSKNALEHNKQLI